MAVITPDTFDPLRRYVGVRLQQGVPIVDADENEREDVRRFELRAFLKWFVGDGVPEGNDGFHIDALPAAEAANDFMIRAGAAAAPGGTGNVEKGLKYVGRCLVDGYDVIIEGDVKFSRQPLHESQPGAEARASAYGVPTVKALDVSQSNVNVVVYLDVWHRLVTPTEDPTLVHPGLGTESCSRLRREWVVRARLGGDAPAPGDGDYLAGHAYYQLAAITRRAGDPVIGADSIRDTREQRLLVPPSTIVNDAFGTNPQSYRRGTGRPRVSLRESINALLSGRLPMSPPIQLGGLGNVGSYLSRNACLYASNSIVAVWNTYMGQLYVTRLDLNHPEMGFSPSVQITSGVKSHAGPSIVLLPSQELLVVYQDDYASGSQTRLFYKRAPLNHLEDLANAPEQRLNPASTEKEISPQVYLNGNIVTVFFYNNETSRWWYRRFSSADMTPIDSAPVLLWANPLLNQLHVIYDNFGQKLSFVNVNPTNELVVGEFDPAPATGNASIVDLIATEGQALEPFLIRASGSDDLQIFYSLYGGSFGIHTTSRDSQHGGPWRSPIVVPNTTGTENLPGGERQPYVLVRGRYTWLFFNRGSGVAYVRLDLRARSWLGPYSLQSSGLPPAISGGAESFVSAINEPFGFPGASGDDHIWVLYGQSNLLFAKQIFAEI